MNERIQELAEQAHCYACEYAQRPDYNPHNPYNQLMYKQRYDSKFAELIVRECSSICRGVGDAVWAEQHQSNIGTARTCDAAILLYFGVEE